MQTRSSALGQELVSLFYQDLRASLMRMGFEVVRYNIDISYYPQAWVMSPASPVGELDEGSDWAYSAANYWFDKSNYTRLFHHEGKRFTIQPSIVSFCEPGQLRQAPWFDDLPSAIAYWKMTVNL